MRANRDGLCEVLVYGDYQVYLQLIFGYHVKCGDFLYFDYVRT